jgi:pimeloyl-ACP methyl ester carboxylesterase
MNNPRKHGNSPYSIVLVHGGPGAVGEMQPVACELGESAGVLEPMQTETTVQGQVDELKTIIERSGDPPVTLVGFSWGAWLSCILAASHQVLVKKLILISSGPFELKYSESIIRTRLSRLDEADKRVFLSFCQAMDTATELELNLETFASLISKTDSFDILPEEPTQLHFDFKQYLSIWREAEKLRSSGRLLEIARQVRCPTLAIHGDYDPHPAEGVREPLSKAIKDFRFVLLKDCGHYPWKERKARSAFFRLLKAEMWPQ